eukprot:TRINITY_DN2116_c0_g1_i2.p2 TRINITY_DN2116_c0_g1~~TRINITY_DN2116_c0_g1_i2.p2  ORF type:complete len:117 (+),score=19.26 TRINITY_DN2116_c0_g1_i2:46-396(+)
MASNAPVREDDRKRTLLLDSDATLRNATRELKQANRNALETEETGFRVLSDLARQREVIARTTNTLEQIDSNVSGARAVLHSMSRRACCKKVVIAIMALLLTVVLSVVVYFAFIKK